MRVERSMHRPLRLTALALTLLALTGCASVATDGAVGDVRQLVGGERAKAIQPVVTEDDEHQRGETVAALLSKPLDMDSAVRLAMLNNRSVQASLAELGIAQADLAQATRLENPKFTFARKKRANEVEYERSYGIDILGVLTLPWRSAMESRNAEQAKLRVAGDITRIALEARKAWVNAVAAEQTARYMADIAESAEASAELSRRMATVGNFNKLSYNRAQLYYAETMAQLARAKQAAMEAREALIRVLALSGRSASELKLPERLPDLPKQARSLDDLGPSAAEKRLDLQMARREVDGVAKSLGLTKTTRFINVLETSYLNNSSNEGPKQHGYELSLELPLFDWGSAKVARAEALYRQALNRAAEIGINAESELRASYSAYRTHYDLARHYRDEVVPLRRAIADESQLRYNGMLASVFELLADSREQVGGVMAAIEAQRAFWEADANLEMATTAGSPAGTSLGGVMLPSAGNDSAGH